jgi:inosine triphosphate pyrophosphatase
LAKPTLKPENILYFITGNAGKFTEISALIPNVRQLKLQLDEIQSLDPQVVIARKLEQAAKIQEGSFIVEDTSLSFNCLRGLPGPFITWFEATIGIDGLAALAGRYDDHRATAITTIGYRDHHGSTYYFKGSISGTIVPPAGTGFGWDPIFMPDGYDASFGVLGKVVKNKISMRALATQKLASHLKSVSLSTTRPPVA